ncbi:uncharacterized protein LOC119107712 [Pollicipes pollicipes]|uniref:uncharacterized protein LOC119107712 n=1 Tax=Pollicipes pollicipes TaxID=41117 RepID=UPI00188589B8|nr:uncharacterized protein LOC119107712 [Pollicipes pollicipes]
MRVLLALLLCAGPAWARDCETGWYRAAEGEPCAPCSVCAADQRQLLACRPFADTLCEGARNVPPPPVTAEEAHRNRLAEERVRADLQRATQELNVQRTRLETLVYEWQTAVFVVSILVTFALVFSFLALVLRRTRTVVRKGVEDYSHLILNREDEHRDGNDQSSLAYADFDTIKIGRRPFDSPYTDLSAPRSSSATRASATCATNFNHLPRHQV